MHYEQLSREALMAVLMGPIPTDLAEAASAAEPAVAAAPCQETAVLVSQHKALCPPCPPVQTEPRQALEAALDLDLPLPVRHRLGAARELILRTLGQRLAGAPMMDSPQTVKDWLVLRCCGLQHEVFWVLFLDARHRLTGAEMMFRGTLAQTSVYPREVVKAALLRNAAAVVVAHNHPTGDPEPSRADEHLTHALKSALQLVDVRLLDHVVVGDARTVSFAERGLL
jgi:DNA repair protein RadC